MSPKKRRYEHWLFKTGKGAWPPVVFCLSVGAQWVRTGNTGYAERASIVRWDAIPVYRSDGNYAAGQPLGGSDAASFWSAIRSVLSRIGNVWILSHDTRTALSTLGVWDGIESQTIIPAGEDSTSDDIGRVRMPTVQEAGEAPSLGGMEQVGSHPMRGVRNSVGEFSGSALSGKPGKRRAPAPLMILSDPPIILHLSLAGQKGKITWVDAANYGVAIPLDTDAVSNPPRVLAEWFLRAASTLHSLGPCGWRATAGAQALHVYRSVYLAAPILSHTSQHATALESGAIFGGRNECFRLGRVPGPIHVFDFRSMYSYVMATERLPVRLERMGAACALVSIPWDQSDRYTIAEVDIETTEANYPWRGKDEVHYPTGRFTTTIAGEELALAMRRGDVHRVRRYAVYESAPVLSGYATELAARRQAAIAAGDGAIAAWIKRLLVSLPGKFSQRDRRWVTRHGADPIYEWGEWRAMLPGVGICRWRSIGGIVQVLMEGEYVSGAVPAITAAVCSAGRMRLLRAMLACGRENVYYVDTDSIVTNDAGKEALVQHGWVRPDELGYLRETIAVDGAEIYGLKHYRIGNLLRYAGSPGGGEAYYSEAGPTPFQPWIGASLRNQEKPEAKRMRRSYARGPGRYDQTREPGGWVKPMELDEWQSESM